MSAVTPLWLRPPLRDSCQTFSNVALTDKEITQPGYFHWGSDAVYLGGIRVFQHTNLIQQQSFLLFQEEAGSQKLSIYASRLASAASQRAL